jgi:hypothetical protein
MPVKVRDEKRLNNVMGFCLEFPRWTRTVRICFRGWRFDAKEERSKE